jgi:hypothetical protein
MFSIVKCIHLICLLVVAVLCVDMTALIRRICIFLYVYGDRSLHVCVYVYMYSYLNAHLIK